MSDDAARHDVSAPIGELGLLSDCERAALVSSSGTIEWLCTTRFDSPSLFARLLDTDAGHWSITPATPHRATRRYLPDTLIHEIVFDTAGGRMVLADALQLDGDLHDPDVAAPGRLLRHLRVESGEVDVLVELRPRPGYATVDPALRAEAPGRLRGAGFTLVGDVELQVDAGAGRAWARMRLSAGERRSFVLLLDDSPAPAPTDVPAALLATAAAWRAWVAEHQGHEGPYRAAVGRSAMVLQALTFRPTGAIVAAATTSLPEVVGGTANWDYRFAWLRDASMTVDALNIAVCATESHRYLQWMAQASCAGGDGRLQIVFAGDGRRDLDEEVLGHLAGYRDSRPVRIGNDAWRQQQHDVAGEVLRTALLASDGEPFDEAVGAFLCHLADVASTRWRRPDSGIWEGREGVRHYVSSKVLSWCALDSAVQLAPLLGDRADPRRWRRAADAARRSILRRGWNADVGAYTGAYGSDHLDVSNLLMPIYGFLPADDERMSSTIDRIAGDLGDDGLVSRWTGDDEQGWFVLASCWLADCLARRGDVDRARHVLERVLGHANELGLLSEQIDRSSGELIGNFPQTFAHAGVIIAAASIDRAERGVPGPSTHR